MKQVHAYIVGGLIILGSFSLTINLIVANFSALPIAHAGSEQPPSPRQREKCQSSSLPGRFKKVITSTNNASGINLEMIDLMDDVLRRNSCQRADIFSVLQKIDAVTGGMRSAVYNCNAVEFDALEKEYITAKMELYYVRHFIQPNKNEVIPNHKIESEMKEQFKGKLSEEAIEKALHDFSLLYSNLDRYRKCENVTWKAMVKKIKKLKNTWKDIKQTYKDLEQDYEESYRRDADKKNPNKDNTKEGKKGFLEKHLGIRLKAEDVQLYDVYSEKGRKKFLEKLGKKADEFAQTIDDVFELADEAEKRYEDAKKVAESGANIQVRYFESSGINAETFLCNVHSLNETLKRMNEKTQEFDKCARLPLEKQCQGTPVKNKELPEEEF